MGMGWGAVLQWAAFVAVTGYALFLFGYVVYSRFAFIRLGRPSLWDGRPAERVREALRSMLGHRTLLQDRRSGLMHLVLFYGFIALQFGAVELIGKGLFPGWSLPLGPLYPLYQVSQEAAVVLVLTAVGYAAYRRYVEKLPRLKRGWKPAAVLLFIAGLMASVLLSQGMELLGSGERSAYQPVSSWVASAAESAGIGSGSGTAEALFYAGWWLHLLILLSFLVYVPQSKHAHILFAPINLALRKSGAPGRLSPIDFTDDSAEYYGASRIEDFTRSQLVDLYACVECGRCTSVCPAAGSGKTLSPMALIVNLRDHLTSRGAAVTSRSPWMPAFAFPSMSRPAQDDVRLAGDVVTEEELWACTTCRNCEEVCPVGNEHVDKILELRRYLVLTEGSMPPEASRTLSNLERQGNPWGRSRKERGDWRNALEPGINAPLIHDAEAVDYVLHVGSMGSYDLRSQKITRALVKLLNHAGVSFAMFGSDERNSGDTARRLGNEYLFRQLAEETLEQFQRFGVKRIVTIDPHAYHTFKNEYPDLGMARDVEVLHHTELLARLIREERIKPARKLTGTVAFHDPCYLGRHNGVLDSPRTALAAVPGMRLAEMERNGRNSLCCGAGGGLMWLEETEGQRMNLVRTSQALAVKPDVIATACPYCLTMLSDGVSSMDADERVRVMDIAELLAEVI